SQLFEQACDGDVGIPFEEAADGLFVFVDHASPPLALLGEVRVRHAVLPRAIVLGQSTADGAPRQTHRPRDPANRLPQATPVDDFIDGFGAQSTHDNSSASCALSSATMCPSRPNRANPPRNNSPSRCDSSA